MANALPNEPIAKQQNEVVNTPNNPKINFWTKIGVSLTVFRSIRQASKIMKGLNEAKQIRAGKRQGKSYDEFLKEI